MQNISQALWNLTFILESQISASFFIKRTSREWVWVLVRVQNIKILFLDIHKHHLVFKLYNLSVKLN